MTAPTKWLLLAALTLCFGCELLQPSLRRADTYTKRVSYHRGSCFGRCPVYTLDLYDNGLLVYTGERFTERTGTWQRTIDRRRATALLDSFERADFANYPRNFRSEIADASVIDVSYLTRGGRRYQTSYSDYAPEELRQLDRAMRRLAALPGYRPYHDSIPANPFAPVVDPAAVHEFIVELAPGTNAGAWVVSLANEGGAVRERISPNGNYYLITTRARAAAAEDVLDKIRRNEAVLSAQMNRAVRPR